MKKVFLIVVFVVISCTLSFAQGIVKGRVVAQSGDTLKSAIVKLKNNAFVGTTTDEKGNFFLRIPDSSAQVLLISMAGYKTIEDTIKVAAGETLNKNFKLEVEAVVGRTVNIKKVRTKEIIMESVKQKSAVSLDYISAETIKKTGDANLQGAIARVSGVSTNGAFITVRGIGDRYVKTTFNGMRIPTLDPFTNNIKLDMFPATLVENVIITKTASPDLPGDWAGAYISVETKKYPEKLTINVETSAGYNSQSTFQNLASSQRSSTDWMGYDNGYRNQDITKFVTTNYQPTKYDEFVALGMGDYFKSIGVTSSATFKKDADNYYKLGLVQLGLLGKSQFNDPLAVANAKDKYQTGTYQADAYKVMNSKAVAFNKTLPNNWRNTERQAPLNFTQSFSFGSKLKLFKQPLGFLVGFRYATTTVADPNAGYYRITGGPEASGKYVDVDTLYQKVTRETNEWSALVNVNYQYHKNHSISLLFMPNVNGSNNVSVATYPESNRRDYLERQIYESRKQFIYQLKSEHFIPWHKMKVDGNASYTMGSSIVPDFKVTGVPIDKLGQNRPVMNAARYFRYLNENTFDSKASLELPLKGDEVNGDTRKIKVGGAFQYNDRTFQQYAVGFVPNLLGADQLANANPNRDPFSLDNFDLSPVLLSEGPTLRALRAYQVDPSPSNSTIGFSNVMAAYAMADYTIKSKFRVSGGLRVERAYMYTDVRLFDSLKLADNDPRREIVNLGISNPGRLDQVSFLPSLTFIYNIKKDEKAPTNLRVNFSQTVARPSLRELSTATVFDYEFNDFVIGNPNLKMVNVNNYDMRFERYLKSGDNFSGSLFYKDFKNYIELYQGQQGLTWTNNTNNAWLAGVELEGKKKLGKFFELRSNITLVNSRSVFTPKINDGKGGSIDGETAVRTLFGQSPYLINGIATYNADSIGLVATVSYNVQGAKLVIDGDLAAGIPPVYERPRHVIDLKVSKKLGKFFTVSLKVNDILNAPRVRSYMNSDGKYILDYDRFRYGTSYVLSVSYKL